MAVLHSGQYPLNGNEMEHVALLGSEIVGTVGAVLTADHLYVRGMAVLPVARGKRAGDLLLEEIERFARLNNGSRLVLSTTPFLVRAIRLYQRHGFRRTGEGVQDLFGTPLFTMQKIIGDDQTMSKELIEELKRQD